MPTNNTYGTATRTGNVVQAYKGSKASGSGAFTQYVALDPRKQTVILVAKAGETITVAGTNDVAVADIETATYVTLDTGTTDLVSTPRRGLSGLKITGTPASATVNMSVIQFLD